MENKTDLQRFVELYASFGIDCVVHQENDKQLIDLGDTSYTDNNTRSNKFGGYSGFYSCVVFDSKGKFLRQGFWE